MRPGQSCPGVGRSRCIHGRRQKRFNEAGAIMPRSGTRWHAGTTRRLLASMRPGQSCPGVAWRHGHHHVQGAASFNEAGAIMPRSGHDPRNGRTSARTASMRPGQSCPGVVGS